MYGVTGGGWMERRGRGGGAGKIGVKIAKEKKEKSKFESMNGGKKKVDDGKISA